MFAAAERPGSIALPMRLNRATYGSMCDRALWICPLFTVFLWQAERLKEWQSEVQEKEQGAAIFAAMESNRPSWGLATSGFVLVNHEQRSENRRLACRIAPFRSSSFCVWPLPANSGLRLWRRCNGDVGALPRSGRKKEAVTMFLWRWSFKSQQADLSQPWEWMDCLEVWKPPPPLARPPIVCKCVSTQGRTVFIWTESCDHWSLFVILLVMNSKGATTNCAEQVGNKENKMKS